ncbi:hypothetical protein KAR91_69100 [Candidatus Pacearchaeota archaeon]|nr:hypothetical protein [Candidatus Pacearchaeota archaeon]
MGGTEVSAAQSDHLEVDDVEEMLATLGSFGIFPGMGAAEGARGIYWVDANNGSDANDGTTAALAKATIDAAIALTTANQDDIILVLPGQYDENANTGGVLVDVAGITMVGVNPHLCTVLNSNGAAVGCMTVSVSDCSVAGLDFIETTFTVEGIIGGASLIVHDCRFTGTMENGISNANSKSEIFNCVFSGMTNDGIELTAADAKVYDNLFESVTDNAINLNGDAADTNFIYNNIINGGGGTTDYAVQILLGDNNIVSNNWFGSLGTWPVNNTGSDNIFVDNDDGTAYTGTHDITTGNDKTETTITGLNNLDLWTNGHVYISIDVQTLIAAGEGGVCTVLLKEKIDNSTYRPIKIDVIDIAGGGVVHPTLDWGFEGVESGLNATVQCTDDVTATRTITWKFKMV